MADVADPQDEQSPWTRGGFIAAAVVVAVVAVLGIVLAVTTARNSGADDAAPAPAPSVSTGDVTVAPPEPSPSAVAEDGSICGLDGEVLDGTLATAPAAEWQYQGTTAYPTSTTYGPGETSAEGVRSCFQRSPEGAVFAAANAVAQGAEPESVASWLDYFVAQGPSRDAVVNAGGAVDTSGARAATRGFRLLSYDGDSARVDVAVQGSTEGQVVNLSMVYDLVWEDGDWKLAVADPSAPIDVATLPDLAGYTSWGE